MGWHRTARTLVFCAWIAALSPACAGEKSVDALVRQAHKLADKGDYAGAYMAAELAVARRPEDQALKALASSYQRLGLQAMQAYKSLKPAPEPETPKQPALPETTAEDRRELEPPPTLQPENVRRSFDLRDNPRSLTTKVAEAYGIRVVFDSDYPPAETPRKLRIDNVTWSEAIYALQLVTGSFFVPLNTHVALFAKETAVKRGEVEPNVAVSIPFPETMTAQDLQDVANAVRQVFSLTKVSIDSTQRAMVLRDRVSRVRPAMEIAKQLMNGPAEVYIDAELVSIDKQSDLGLGLQLPTSYRIVAYTPTPVVNPLPSGTMNLATISTAWGYLGVGIGDSQLLATLTGTFAKTLIRTSLRSVNGQPATIHVGEKYPVIQMAYATTQNPSGGTFAPPPAINFEDLGVMMKITPHVHDAKSLTLEFEAEFTQLTGNTSDNMPIIASRKFTMPVSLNFGQSAVVAGLVQDTVTYSKNGLPLLPGFPWLGSTVDNGGKSTDLLLILRPTLLSLPPSEHPPYPVWTGTEVRALPLDFWDRAAIPGPGLP